MVDFHYRAPERIPSGFFDTFRVAWSQQLPAGYEKTEFTIVDLTETVSARRQVDELGIAFDPTWQHQPRDAVFEASRVAAMGDVHGNYNHLILLLENGGVVDADLNWSWGAGHLVFNGDVFDKGPGVTESLWLIYKLEQQAEAAGGMVHYLLGNHACG